MVRYEDVPKRAARVIASLEKTKQKLTDELNKISAYNHSTSLSYGSELAAGEMLGKEEQLKSRIDAINNDIKLVQTFVSQNSDVEDLINSIQNNHQRVSNSKKEIADLEERIKYFEKENESYYKILSLLRLY